MNNKRGWIRIVEAFVAILLIVGIVLFMFNKGVIGKKDVSRKIYDIESSILQEIALNDSLRIIILNASPLPTDAPAFVQNFIDSRAQNYLNCTARICDVDVTCPMNSSVYIEKEVYAQLKIISGTLQKYQPRQFKIFCWMK